MNSQYEYGCTNPYRFSLMGVHIADCSSLTPSLQEESTRRREALRMETETEMRVQKMDYERQVEAEKLQVCLPIRMDIVTRIKHGYTFTFVYTPLNIHCCWKPRHCMTTQPSR